MRHGSNSRKISRSTVHKDPEEISWRDHLVMLLHIASEIEHALMVQYLYAAYSLGGDHLDEEDQVLVAGWKRTLLEIAKEEMGHLLTVQNILMLVGGPPNLDRQDFPWDAEYYPFPFTLEPVSLDSLACYIYTEMPRLGDPDTSPYAGLSSLYRLFDEDLEAIKKSVQERASKAGAEAHQIDALYREIIGLIADEERVPDSAFREDSYLDQMDPHGWTRNYRSPPAYLTATGDPDRDRPMRKAAEHDAVVLVFRAATRAEAKAALEHVAEQGESPGIGPGIDEPSHFDRFLDIYEAFKRRIEARPNVPFRPARNVPVNPSVRPEVAGKSLIDAPRARDWARLFDLRYRMLLSYLAHALRPASPPPCRTPNLRSMLMHRAFGEMYNLKAVAERLVILPRSTHGGAGRHPEVAGPPFELPWDLAIPHHASDIWRLHLSLLDGAGVLVGSLLRDEPEGDGRQYLKTLSALDGDTRTWVARILAGQGVGLEEPA